MQELSSQSYYSILKDIRSNIPLVFVIAIIIICRCMSVVNQTIKFFDDSEHLKTKIGKL